MTICMHLLRRKNIESRCVDNRGRSCKFSHDIGICLREAEAPISRLKETLLANESYSSSLAWAIGNLLESGGNGLTAMVDGNSVGTGVGSGFLEEASNILDDRLTSAGASTSGRDGSCGKGLQDTADVTSCGMGLALRQGESHTANRAVPPIGFHHYRVRMYHHRIGVYHHSVGVYHHRVLMYPHHVRVYLIDADSNEGRYQRYWRWW